MTIQNKLALASAFLLGGGLGVLVGTLITKKEMQARLDKEVADVKENYRYIHKDDYESPTDYIAKNRPDEIVDPALVRLEAGEALHVNSIIEHVALNEEIKEQVERYQTGSVFNAFQNETADKDLIPEDADETLYQNLLAQRTETAPFLISVEEYFDEKPHFQKLSVTYFAGDNIVCYEDDTIMLDPEESFGVINLSRFGIKSDSEHIVYVRNPRIDVDYEIVKDEGKYADLIAHLQGNDEDD